MYTSLVQLADLLLEVGVGGGNGGKILYNHSMVKFLHTADWQLGMTRHFLKGEAQARFTAARLDVIEEIGNLAIREGCEFVVTCGDVFESNQVGRQILTRAFEKMKAVSGIRFYLLPGNHDPLDASSIYRSPTFKMHKPENVVVLDGSEAVQAAAGVELIAAPWPNKRPTTDLVAEACQDLERTRAVRIVVGHGATDDPSLSPNQTGPELIGLEGLGEKIRAGVIHYVALGDRHSKTEVGDTRRVWYSGAPEPTDFDEIDPGYALVVEVDVDNISVDPKKLATWKFVSEERELNGEEDIRALEEWMKGLEAKDRSIVKLATVGSVSLAQKARLDDILAHYGEMMGALETWERRSELVVMPDEVDHERLDLSGFMRDAVSELSEMAKGGQEALTARGALALLYRLKETRE